MLSSNRKRTGSGIVIDPTQVPSKAVLVAGIDAGSTETRLCVADVDDYKLFANEEQPKAALDSLMTTYRIPSMYAGVPSAREIQSISPNLEDNYDSTIVMMHNGAEHPMLSRQRIIRGRKMQDTLEAVPLYLDSSTDKSDNVIFYVNVIDVLGYGILQKYNGQIPKEVEVYLSLSVRPKELNTACRAKMTANLVGSYTFMWGGVSVSMAIKSVNFTTEPQAEIEGTVAVYDLRTSCGIDPDKNSAMADKLSSSDCYIHIEGGGSSVGVEVMKNGEIIDAASSSFPKGGNYLAQLFRDQCRDKNNLRVTKEAANSSIISCRLRDGANVLDVSKIVSTCKNQLGLEITESVRHDVVDMLSDLSFNEVEFVTLGGRLFMTDASGDSIANYMEKYIHQISPNTSVIVLQDNLIAQGNLIIGLNSAGFDEKLMESDVTNTSINTNSNATATALIAVEE